MRGEELVDRRGGADERREARAGAPTGAAHLLPGRGDRPRIADAERGIQPTDVDAELERIRRHDAADTAIAQALLDLVALVRQVAAAVAADRVGCRGRLERLAEVAGQDLDRRPRAGEGDRLHAAADEPLGDVLPVSSAELRIPSSSFATGGLMTRT